MPTTLCAHAEVITPGDGEETGTCRYCGQTVVYNKRDFKSKPRLIKLGHINGKTVLPKAGWQICLSEDESNELTRVVREPPEKQTAEEKKPEVSETIEAPGETNEPETETAEGETEHETDEDKSDQVMEEVDDENETIPAASSIEEPPPPPETLTGAMDQGESAPLYVSESPTGRKTKNKGKLKWRKVCAECEYFHFIGKDRYCSSQRCPKYCPMNLRPPYKEKEEPKLEKPLTGRLATKEVRDAFTECAVGRSGKAETPALPEWNESWGDAVKITWLKTYVELYKKGGGEVGQQEGLSGPQEN